MKKKYLLFIILFLIINFVSVTKAQAYLCRYKGDDLDPDGAGDIENRDFSEYIDITIDQKNKTYKIEASGGLNVQRSSVIASEGHPVNADKAIKGKKYSMSNYVEMMHNKCPKAITLIAFVETQDETNYLWGLTQNWSLGVLLDLTTVNDPKYLKSGNIFAQECADNNDPDSESAEYAYCFKSNVTDSDGGKVHLCYNTDSYVTWHLSEKDSSKDAIDMSFACNTYSTYYNNASKYYSSYKKCVDKHGKQDDTCIEKMNTYHSKSDLLKNFCSVIINHSDSADGCLKKCINLRSDITGITNGEDEVKRACFMTEEIIAFIYNILKWGKYIAPVIVIVLSILDFIKAIAAQDDDAMKKAQGKFVKRLISAALLFLLPLIIDYLLDVFDMNNSACNINTLFK